MVVNEIRTGDMRRQGLQDWDIDFVSPEQFADAKLIMLRNEMYIEPTEEEIVHLYEQKTEYAINRVVLGIISRHWS